MQSAILVAISNTKAEEELRQVKYTLDMVFMFEVETLQFVYLNKGAVASMVYTQHELLQMTLCEIKPQFTKKQFCTVIEPLLTGAGLTPF